MVMMGPILKLLTKNATINIAVYFKKLYTQNAKYLQLTSNHRQVHQVQFIIQNAKNASISLIIEPTTIYLLIYFLKTILN